MLGRPPLDTCKTQLRHPRLGPAGAPYGRRGVTWRWPYHQRWLRPNPDMPAQITAGELGRTLFKAISGTLAPDVRKVLQLPAGSIPALCYRPNRHWAGQWIRPTHSKMLSLWPSRRRYAVSKFRIEKHFRKLSDEACENQSRVPAYWLLVLLLEDDRRWVISQPFVHLAHMLMCEIVVYCFVVDCWDCSVHHEIHISKGTILLDLPNQSDYMHDLIFFNLKDEQLYHEQLYQYPLGSPAVGLSKLWMSAPGLSFPSFILLAKLLTKSSACCWSAIFEKESRQDWKRK